MDTFRSGMFWTGGTYCASMGEKRRMRRTGCMGLLEILLVTAAAGVGGTGMGGLLATMFHRDSGREASLLLSFAAGVMVGVSCFGLLTEAAAPGGRHHGVMGGLAGCGITAGLNGLLDHRHPGGGLLLAGLVMAAAIALHNVPEGMVIGASFIGGTVRQGWTLAAVIGLHNVPEGMAIAAPMVAGGERRWKAAGIAALSGAPTVLGAALGWGLGTLGPTALTLTLSFAAGVMLYVVFGELLPESAGLWESRLPALSTVAGLLVGMLIG